MTEAEWLACDEPQMAIEFIAQTASERKCRLLAAALCRHVFPLVTAECGHRAVATAEDYADDRATAGELRSACERVLDAFRGFDDFALANTDSPLAFRAKCIALEATRFAASDFD